jgi:hypothetical protein
MKISDIVLDISRLKKKYPEKRQKEEQNLARVYLDEHGDYWVKIENRLYIMGDSGPLLSPRAKPEIKLKFLFTTNHHIGRFGEVKWDIIMEKIKKHKKRHFKG